MHMIARYGHLQMCGVDAPVACARYFLKIHVPPVPVQDFAQAGAQLGFGAVHNITHPRLDDIRPVTRDGFQNTHAGEVEGGDLGA